MRILIIHSSPWNDITSGNNVLTNWFDGFSGEFANIYRGSGKPYNKCCSRYFQLSDSMMLQSFWGPKAGKVISCDEKEEPKKHGNSKIDGLKKYNNEFLSLIRSAVWLTGRINQEELQKFLDVFQPEVVFTCRKASLATLRLERIVHSMTDAPFVAFTGDDEYSLQQYRFDPFFWIDRFCTRAALRRNVKFYSWYLTLSEDQAQDYHERFGIATDVLRKCQNQDAVAVHEQFRRPFRIVYAGKLYCNRWKTLEALSEAVKKINAEFAGTVFELAVYALGTVSEEERSAIEICPDTRIYQPVPASELPQVFAASDIVLHVESFDRRNKYDTRYSFSTKIIDYLGSGCAMMAICWKEHAGYKYLQNEDAAICISNLEEIYPSLRELASHPEKIELYAQKARTCLETRHSRALIQKMLSDIFTGLMEHT